MPLAILRYLARSTQFMDNDNIKKQYTHLRHDPRFLGLGLKDFRAKVWSGGIRVDDHAVEFFVIDLSISVRI